jgi:NRPS condensation-like uncharacterized protein
LAPETPTDNEPATLQSRLEDADHDGREGEGAARATAPSISDPVALLRHLDAGGHFHRDSGAGRLYHRGMVSLRETVATDSLHVVVDGNRVAAHVDGVSPLAVRPEGSSAYSVPRILAHNLAGLVQDLASLLRGRQGDHSCELDCEWVSAEENAPADHLLDPKASAWSVQLEARVAGVLDEARLRAAISAALGQRARGRDPLDVVICRDDAELDAARIRLQSMVVAVDERPPLHVYLARHPAGDVLMLNLNHATGDAFGALAVLHSIAGAYAGDAETHDPLDFLALRDLPVRPASEAVPAPVRWGQKVVERLRNAVTRPARLAADEPRDDPGYGFLLVELSTAETADVKGAEHSRTSNHVLMAALHLAIGDWNLQHDAPSRHIAVLQSTNLRPAAWRPESVGNFSVTARVSTSRRERAGPASALTAITAQAKRNKRTRTGIALMAGLDRAGLLSLWAKQSVTVLQPLTANRGVDAAVLCNLGTLDETPSFGPDLGEPVNLWCSTPARSPASLCIGAVTTRGRLHLTFRYPHRLFGPDAARRFAECYLDHVRWVAADSSG